MEGQRPGIYVKRPDWWALIAPGPAVLLGAGVMRAHGTEPGIWAFNIAVWLGATASCIAIKVFSPRFPRLKWIRGGFFGLSLLTLLSTFWFPSLQGVHRWLLIGTVRLHAAAIFMPALLVALSSIYGKPKSYLAAALTLSVAVLLVVQPDAAQGSAFAIATGFLFTRRELSRKWRWFVIGGLLTCVIVVWLRPDPLPAVEYVEGIVGVAWKLSPWLAAACVGALAVVPTPFVWFRWQNKMARDADLALALAIYFAVTLLAALVGNFPVPVMGYGASPIIGYFIAIGWLLVVGGDGDDSAYGLD